MEKEFTFLGMDGLLHCNVCKETLEVFYPQGSLVEGRKHHRQCACERKAYLPLSKLKSETNVDKKRIYDRILERCVPLKIDGNSRREAIANDNVHTMKKILNI